jgi:hypothetical protein
MEELAKIQTTDIEKVFNEITAETCTYLCNNADVSEQEAF